MEVFQEYSLMSMFEIKFDLQLKLLQCLMVIIKNEGLISQAMFLMLKIPHYSIQFLFLGGPFLSISFSFSLKYSRGFLSCMRTALISSLEALMSTSKVLLKLGSAKIEANVSFSFSCSKLFQFFLQLFKIVLLFFLLTKIFFFKVICQ